MCNLISVTFEAKKLSSKTSSINDPMGKAHQGPFSSFYTLLI